MALKGTGQFAQFATVYTGESLDIHNTSSTSEFSTGDEVLISDAKAIEESFFEARSAAFAQFEATKQQEFVALQNLWQSKEDNGPYDVDYVPE